MAVSTLLLRISLLQAACLYMDSHQNGISRFISAWKGLCLKQEPRSEEGITQPPHSRENNQARGRARLFPPVCIQAVKSLRGLIATLFLGYFPLPHSGRACSGSFPLPVLQEPLRAHWAAQGPEAASWVCYEPGAPTSPSQHPTGTDAHKQNSHACPPPAQARDSPVSNITAEVSLQPFP